MNPITLTIDGQTRDLPLNSTPETPVQHYLKLIQQHIVSETILVSSIRVDGTEITPANEQDFAERTLAEIQTIDIQTAHPREIADEILQNLVPFINFLETLSQQCADLVQDVNYYRSFSQLLDGIHTLMEAVTNVKHVLRIGTLQPVLLLEADLVSILKDLLSTQESRQEDYILEILRIHLPNNLHEWKTNGIPTLMASRDS